MNQALITAIAEGNFSAILNITSQLTDSERYETIAAIRVLDPYSEKDFPRKNVAKKNGYYHNHLVSQALNYALITMVREESDMPKVIMDRKGYQGKPYKENPYVIFRYRYMLPVIEYYEQFPQMPISKKYSKTDIPRNIMDSPLVFSGISTKKAGYLLKKNVLSETYWK